MPLAILKADYIDMCDGDHCAAMVLSVFEYWHGIKLGGVAQERVRERSDPKYKSEFDMWIYKSVDAIAEDLLGHYGRGAITGAIKLLVSKGYLSTRNNPDDKLNKTRQYYFNVSAVQEDVNRWAEKQSLDIKPLKNVARSDA